MLHRLRIWIEAVARIAVSTAMTTRVVDPPYVILIFFESSILFWIHLYEKGLPLLRQPFFPVGIKTDVVKNGLTHTAFEVLPGSVEDR